MEKIEAESKPSEIEMVSKERDALPFDLEEGKVARMGVFLNPHPPEGHRIKKVGVMDDHFRSALWGKVVFADKNNPTLQYRDVDLKGVGPVSPTLQVEELKPLSWKQEALNQAIRGETPWGFSDLGWAEKDRDFSEMFVKKGLRTRGRSAGPWHEGESERRGTGREGWTL